MVQQQAGQSLAWLREAAASSKLFQGAQATSLSASEVRRSHERDEDGTHYMPMAARGNELFVVVDNSIRWADLSRLKERWEEEQEEGKGGGGGRAGGPPAAAAPYKTLKLKLHEQIRQLVVSPNEEVMAVVTEHNVVVVLLPEPASLAGAADEGPVRVKTHTIGPTIHVTSQSPVVRTLWHPLGVDGNCLVTVTASAVVRVWELDRRTLGSFSEPSVALDLRKLRYATSQEQNVGAGDMTVNRTFTTDDSEMEVTAACFGSNAGEAQAFEWSAATLWVAMAEGDVFAVCPLLPSKFQPDDDGTIGTLYELKQVQKQSLEAVQAFGVEKAKVQSQVSWLAELYAQYEEFESYEGHEAGPQRIYTCPRSQGMAPCLQGPFVIVPNDVQDELVPCDIHVIGATAAAGLVNTFAESTFADTGDLGTSFSTICILSTDGRVHICIDIDGVEPQWLPRRAVGHLPTEGATAELFLFEALDTLRPEDAEYGRLPAFTPSTDADEYKFYVTHSKGIYEFSLEPWIYDLEAEIQNSGTEGVKFRTQVLSKGPGTARERILRADPSTPSIATPILFGTENLGRILLTVQDSQPYATAFLDPDVDEEPAQLTWKHGTDLAAKGHVVDMKLDRDVYVPSPAFSARTEMTTFTEQQVDPRHQRLLKEEIRLSPATLSVMTEAHRVLSKETTALNNAAAELFRRCERLHDEFKHQIQRASELASRVKEFNDEDADDDGKEANGGKGAARRKDTVQRRLQEAKERNERLIAKHDELKRRLAHAGGKPLSGKEKAWISEVKKVHAAAGDDSDGDASRGVLLERFQEVQEIGRDLLSQAKERGADATSETRYGQDGKVPPDIRRHKMAQMQALLDRETALVDAAREKLARLGLTG